MRCASAGTWTESGVTPAALWAWRVAGPESAGAGSRAHDSSGLRSLPSTPAPAIWVVGVTSDRVEGPLEPDGPDPQPLHVRTAAAAIAAAVIRHPWTGLRVSRLPPVCTRPTLTSGQLGTGLPTRPGARVESITTVCRTSPASRLIVS